MNEKNLQEIAYRRQAFKFFDRGKSTHQILHQIPRSRSWLFKWKRRFSRDGWKALDSSAKTPKSSPHAYEPSLRHLVLRVRGRLERAKVGLIGARAVRSELQRKRLVKTLPSISTIKRWLRAAGFFHSDSEPQVKAYYPTPQFPAEWFFVSCDWLARYLEGGTKVFVFHTIDHHTHALDQTISTVKTTEAACAHLLHSLTELGVPDFLQIDNDAAFTGLGKKRRVFGRFVRLALHFGIELLFIPPAEPKRNSVVERVNGLWVSSFWEKDHFTSLRDLLKKREKFLKWYEQDYAPPALQGLRVKEASGKRHRRKLRCREVESVPEELPMTEGRIHFVRRVGADGRIEILKERWRVSKSLRGEYVWATINLSQKCLIIYHRRSAKATAKMIKQYAYKIEEKVSKLPPRYRRSKKRVSVLQII